MKKNSKKILIGVVVLSMSMIGCQQFLLTNQQVIFNSDEGIETKTVSEKLLIELLLAKEAEVAEAAVVNALNSGLNHEVAKEIVLLATVKNSLLSELSIFDESTVMGAVETSGPYSDAVSDETALVEATADVTVVIETAKDETAVDVIAVAETSANETAVFETVASEKNVGQNVAEKTSPLMVDTTSFESTDKRFTETNLNSLRYSAISVNNELSESIIGGSSTSEGNGYIPTGDGPISNTGETYN
ncbi:MAG: hypothetical protein VXZ45_04110 [Verrucomicrobiota bacterium]|nr:hypothetical protein [Verrucomicrobiota bacterium]